MLFGNVKSFITRAEDQPLSIDEIPPCSIKDSVTTVGSIFSQSWSIERDLSKPSLLRALSRAFGGSLVSLIFVVILSDSIGFIFPLLLNKLLSSRESNEPLITSFIILSVMIFSLFFETLTSAHIGVYVTRISCRIKSALSALVCGTAANLTPSARVTIGTGKTINMVSNDCLVVSRAVRDCYTIVASPVKILLSFYFLYNLIGFWASFVSVLIFLITFPLSLILTRKLVAARRLTKKHSDARIGFVNECVFAIRGIKLSAMEQSMMNQIDSLRQEELKYLKRVKIIRGFWTLLFTSMPVLISISSIVFFAIFHPDQFTSSTVLTSISLVGMLSRPLNMLPMKVAKLLDARVSVERIESLLLAEQLPEMKYLDENLEKVALQMTPSKFSWQNSTEISDAFSLEIPHSFTLFLNNLLIIQGPVGSGKSSFLHSIINETSLLNGQGILIKKCSFLPQIPWIIAGTVRDNITMFNEFNFEIYSQIIHDCALSQDLIAFDNGDHTVIGDRGITLSGGQKQRIALARCCYHALINQNVELIILDDCFASVDANVAKFLCKNLFPKLLSKFSIVLATHHLHFFQSFNYDLMTFTNGKSSEIIRHTAQSEVDDDVISTDLNKTFTVQLINNKNQSKKSEEVSQTGSISFEVYKLFFRVLGGWHFFFILVSILIISEFFKIFADLTVVKWLAGDPLIGFIPSLFTFGVLKLLAVFAGSATIITVSFGILRASKLLHRELIQGLFMTSLDFFEKTYAGRITNRISQDISNLDSKLQLTLLRVVKTYTLVLGQLITILILIPWLNLFWIPLIYFYYKLQALFRIIYVQLSRIISAVKSPIFQTLHDSLAGSSVIRCSNIQQKFQTNTAFDNSTKAAIFDVKISSWLSLRLLYLGLFIIGSAGFIGVYLQIPAAFLGIILNYAFSISNSIDALLECFISFESSLNSVERIHEYSNLSPEVDVLESKPSNPTPSNPNPTSKLEHASNLVSGTIEFENVTCRYQPDLPIILDNISFKCLKGKRTALVGRTGSGKSTCFNALLRTIPLDFGRILIDDVPISQIPLSILRSSIAIIPQDPLILSTSLRFNLDPGKKYSDGQILAVLQQTGISEILNRITTENILDFHLSEGGSCLSVGTRQLICIARALLSDCAIICVDEASSCLDFEMDKCIQSVLKSWAKGRTIITIAHRLSTIEDYDQIITLEAGKLQQVDTSSVNASV
ncbi:hypothetical protein RCL1_000443 [Eukaryota sp. TZLM3-RCL]